VTIFLILQFHNYLNHLEYGAPIGFQGCLNVSEIDIKNHKGASEFSSDIYKYLRKEASYGSIIGPFDNLISFLKKIQHLF
jgi:hypothetical protein